MNPKGRRTKAFFAAVAGIIVVLLLLFWGLSLLNPSSQSAATSNQSGGSVLVPPEPLIFFGPLTNLSRAEAAVGFQIDLASSMPSGMQLTSVRARQGSDAVLTFNYSGLAPMPFYDFNSSIILFVFRESTVTSTQTYASETMSCIVIESGVTRTFNCTAGMQTSSETIVFTPVTVSGNPGKDWTGSLASGVAWQIGNTQYILEASAGLPLTTLLRIANSMNISTTSTTATTTTTTVTISSP